jgi:hypothetical protein
MFTPPNPILKSEAYGGAGTGAAGQFESHDGVLQVVPHIVMLPGPTIDVPWTSDEHEASHGDISQAILVSSEPNPICESGALAHPGPAFLDIVSVVQAERGGSEAAIRN